MRFLVSLLACAIVSMAAAPVLTPERETYLRRHLGFSAGEVGAVNRGQVVARMLATRDRREFAVVGVVRVRVPTAFIVDSFRDIVAFKQSDLVLQVGRVSAVPTTDDFASLIVDEDDVDDLRWCEPGDCGLRLTQNQIARFGSIDWRSGRARDAAGHMLRDVLREEAAAYVASGAAGLGAYADKRTALDRGRVVSGLLQNTPSLTEPYPEFREYLAKYPTARLEPVDSFLYWSREKFGFRPVVSLTHVAIYRPGGDPAAGALIASRQVYATHYFDASVAVTTVSDGGEAGALMMYLNRTQASLPGGLFSPLARSIARSKTRSGLEEQLGQTRTRLEANYRKSG
jgi:hypothetical protein